MKIGKAPSAIRPLLAAAAKAEIGPAPAPGEMGLIGLRPLSELGARQTQAALKWAAQLNQNGVSQTIQGAYAPRAAPAAETAPQPALPRLASGAIDWTTLLARSGVSLTVPSPAAQNSKPQAAGTPQTASPQPGAPLPLHTLLDPGFVASLVAGRMALAATASRLAAASFPNLGLDPRALALLGAGATAGAGSAMVPPLWDVNAPAWAGGDPAKTPPSFRSTLAGGPAAKVGPASGSSVAEPKDLALIIGQVGGAKGAPPHFRAVFMPGDKAAGPPLIGSLRLDAESAGKWVDAGGDVVGWLQTGSPALQTGLEPVGVGLDAVAFVFDGYGLCKAVTSGDWKAISRYSIGVTGNALSLAGSFTGLHQLSFIGMGFKTVKSSVFDLVVPSRTG